MDGTFVPNIIYIHPESEWYVVKTLAHIKEKGAYVGIAVNPGFAGQNFIDFTRKKVKQLIELKEQYGFKVMIDGHCSPEVIEYLSDLGADGFVLGSSALFKKGRTYKELVSARKGETQ